MYNFEKKTGMLDFILVAVRNMKAWELNKVKVICFIICNVSISSVFIA